VKLPYADRAIIAEDKLRTYLLDPTRLRGGAKAKLLLSMGYEAEEWRRLEADIRSRHVTAEVERQKETEYGTRYEIVAPLQGAGERAILFRSVWQVDIGTEYPRLLTMYPE
jgi:hypothetical protein